MFKRNHCSTQDVFRGIVWLLFICMLCNTSLVLGQSSKDLEEQRKVLLNEINNVNKRLTSNSQNKKNQIEAISLLDRKIKYRKKLEANFIAELKVIQSEITQNSKNIKSLESNLVILKESYSKMLVSSQKQLSTSNNWWFILSSENISQAYKRFSYLKQYSSYRQDQGQEIGQKKLNLEGVKKSLVAKKKTKQALKFEKVQEQKKLLSEQKDFKDQLEKLKGKEENLLKDLAKKEKKSNFLKKAIKDAIEKELAANNKKDNSDKSGVKYVLTPEELIRSKEFQGNKGKLPWPVKSGKIISHYGKHRHPYLPNITVENDGIELETSKGQSVRAVFEGKVSSVIILPTGLKVVILKHGDYSSIYANLSEVNVKDGEIVEIKEKLGRVHVSPDGIGKLEFQIWQGNNGQNPEQWLSK